MGSLYLFTFFCKSNDSVDNVERCVISTKSKLTEHVQFVSTLSKGRNFTKISYDIVAKNSNNVDATFDFVDRIVQFVYSIRQCCFDSVAGVDGASENKVVYLRAQRLGNGDEEHASVTE